MSRPFLLALGLALCGTAAFAQAPGGLKPMPTYVDPRAIPLYAGVAPGSESATQKEVWMSAPGDRVARNVTRPTLTPFLPAKGMATGVGVVVAPGGGFFVLSMDNEGYDVARRLQAHGIAAFVLKYRVNPTPEDLSKMPALPAPAGGAGAGPPPMPSLDRAAMAIADGQEALRMVRRRAKEWGVDPKRLGMMGFSAGGGTVMGVTLKDDPTARPDFIAPIYGGFNHVTVPGDAPPMFIARAADDPLMGKSGFGVVEDWQKAGIPVELHMYEHGGHGFGASVKGTTSDMWMDEFFLWLKDRGTLRASAAGR